MVGHVATPLLIEAKDYQHFLYYCRLLAAATKLSLDSTDAYWRHSREFRMSAKRFMRGEQRIKEITDEESEYNLAFCKMRKNNRAHILGILESEETEDPEIRIDTPETSNRLLRSLIQRFIILRDNIRV